MRIICCQDDVLVFSLSSSFPIEQKRLWRYSFAVKRRRRRRRRGTRAKHRVASIDARARRILSRFRSRILPEGKKRLRVSSVEPKLDPGRRVGRRVNPPPEVGELWKNCIPPLNYL